MDRWRLTIHPPQGSVFVYEQAEGELILGREPGDGGLPLPGIGVAERHVRLGVKEGGLWLEDLGSEGGTFVNGEGVSELVHSVLPLELRVGSYVIWCEPVRTGAEERVEEALPDMTLRLVHSTKFQAAKLGADMVLEDTRRIYHAGARLEEHPAVGVFRIEEVLDRTSVFQMDAVEERKADRVMTEARYALGEEIARGGMGRIYAAGDETLNRQVALKVSSVGGVGMDARFLREAEVLAHLAHPNIVPVYNAGRDEFGRPFYSMKLVKGRTLQAILNKLRVQAAGEESEFTRERLLLVFLKVCDAVSFAHAQGFLHRDLKPENVMVGEFGEVLVLDWGLAKRINAGRAQKGESGAAEEAEVEYTECLEGTPRFMSPEQAEGMLGGLDERSDVYSLGAILFQLLTLRPCVDGRSVEEVLNRVRRGETATMTLSRSELRKLGCGVAQVRKVPEALRAVTLKALSHRREQRYASVQELARDIEAYNSGFATRAEEAGVVRLVVLLIQRHRVASVLLLLMLCGAAVFTGRLMQSERQVRLKAAIIQADGRRLEEQAQIALAQAHEAQAQRTAAQENARKARESESVASQERERAMKMAAGAQIAIAETAERSMNAEEMRRALEKVFPEYRDATWRYLKRVSDSAERTFVVKQPRFVTNHFQPDLQRPGMVHFLGPGPSLCALDLDSGRVQEVRKGGAKLYNFSFSSDGRYLGLLRKTGQDASPSTLLELEDLQKGVSVGTVTLPYLPDARVLFSPVNGGMALVESYGVGVFMVDVPKARVVWESRGSRCLAGFAGGGAWLKLVIAGEVQEVVPATGEVKRRGRYPGTLPERAVALNTASRDWQDMYVMLKDSVRKIQPADGRLLFENRLPPDAGKLGSVAELPALGLFVTLSPVADESAVLQFWSAANGRLVRAILVEMDKVLPEWSLVVHPVSNHVAVMRGEAVKVWALARPEPEGALKWGLAGGEGFGFLAAPGLAFELGRERASEPGPTLDLDVWRWSRAEPQRESSTPGRVGPFPRASVSGDGLAVAVAVWTGRGSDDRVQFYRFGYEGLEFVRDLNVRALPTAFQLSPDGRQLWTGREIINMERFSPSVMLDRRHIDVLPELSQAPLSGASQRWLGSRKLVELAMVSAEFMEKGGNGTERAILVWDAATGKRERAVSAPNTRVLAPSPDGVLLAEAGTDKRVRIRRTEGFAVDREFRVHDAAVSAMDWHPSLPLLATASEDLYVRIWDVRTGDMLEELGMFEEAPSRVQWSPSGQKLALRMESSRTRLIFRTKGISQEVR